MTIATSHQSWGRGLVTSFSLLAGLSTLTCCALPALFISLGLGASLVSLISAAPWLVVLSQYKLSVFSVAVVSLGLAAWLQWRAREMACPATGFTARYCGVFRRFSWSVLGFSGVAILTGAYFAFAAPLMA